jgi:serine/threonine-protein kinase
MQASQCPTCQTPLEPAQRFCPNCGTVVQANAADAPDPMIGQTLGGKYKLNRLLGEGGMGAVYEGEQPLGTAKRKVAVKTLHPHLSRDPNIKARFEREVGTIAELEHPNTIQVFDFGSTPEGILYIVMEFLQGKSLADLLETEGPMAPERVAFILDQVCGSLEEAHRRGIIHRDLKPDNVVLIERAGKRDFVKLLDFGIAKRSSEEDKNEQKLTQQGMVLGTPPYMSPEQFTGRPIDARSDIYSLGVVAYEMLTGRLPFHADTAWEWATQHMTAPPIPLETMAEGMRAPAAMRSAVQRALSKSPNDRFQSVREFIESLSGMPAGTARPPPVSSSTPSRQKTELGQPPLDVGSPFTPASGVAADGYAPSPPIAGPMGSPPGPPPVGAQAYTPAQGNVAFPTPAFIPPAPHEAGGGGRTALLVAAGLIAVASVIAIVFALNSRSGGGGGSEVPFTDNRPEPVPTTVLPTTPTVDTIPVTPEAGVVVPPLNTVVHPPLPHPTTTTTPSHPPPPPRYDGIECARARQFRAAGRSRDAESWALACIAKGGNPN